MGKKFFILILVLIMASSSLTTAFANDPDVYNPRHENSSGYLSGPGYTILHYKGDTYNCWDPNHPNGMIIGDFQKRLIPLFIPPFVIAYWEFVGFI